MVGLLRESRSRTACLIGIVGVTLLPCSSSAFSSTSFLDIAAPPLAMLLTRTTTCRLPWANQYKGSTVHLLQGSECLTGRMGALRRSMVMRPSVALSMVALEPIEDMRDYRDDDLSGRRLFVTGLPSSIDDVRLYLAFEGFGRITEAHVVKPGLGFVVFDDIPTADDALLGMEGSEISGKEIKVKRARSFYIRKEEEARLRMQSTERQREDQSKMFAAEQSRRLREAEEAAFQATLAESKGLSDHLTNFDARTARKLIASEMQNEGLMPVLRGNLGDQGSVQEVRSQTHALGRMRMRAARQGLTAKLAQAAEQQEGSEQVLVGAEAEEEMRLRVLAARRNKTKELSLDAVLSPGSDGRTLSAKDEERIRKQAMIEIMKEGDKLSKTASKNLRPEEINIAHLIRQRVEQIRRYEMLRDNKELLGQITFTTSNPSSRCIDPNEFLEEEEEEKEEDEEGYVEGEVDKFSRARAAEWNVDDDEDEDDDDDEGLAVTPEEVELIALISRDPPLSARQQAAGKLKDDMLFKGLSVVDSKAPPPNTRPPPVDYLNGVMKNNASRHTVKSCPRRPVFPRTWTA